MLGVLAHYPTPVAPLRPEGGVLSDVGVEGAPFATRDASTTGGTVMIGLGNAGAPSGTSSAAASGKTVLIDMGDEDTRSDADAFLLRLALLISSADGADPNASTSTSNALRMLTTFVCTVSILYWALWICLIAFPA